MRPSRSWPNARSLTSRTAVASSDSRSSRISITVDTPRSMREDTSHAADPIVRFRVPVCCGGDCSSGRPAAASRQRTVRSAAHAEHERVSRRWSDSRQVQSGRAGGSAGRRHVAGADVDQRSRRHAELCAAHARPRRRAQSHDRRSGALAGLEHPGHVHGTCPRVCRAVRVSRTAAISRVRRIRCIVVPALQRLGPLHHYVFELYALDTELADRAGRRCIRNEAGHDEGHAGTHARQGCVHGVL